MKKLVGLLSVLFISLFVSASLLAQCTQACAVNAKCGWEILFDGNSVEKWRGKESHVFPQKGWKIENGLLFLAESGGGDIITKEKYCDFELVFSFNLTEGANSGIKYFVDSLVNSETGSVSINGPEYQIIDDEHNIHVKDDPNGLSSTASAYLLYAPENKKLNHYGQWNTGRIVAKNETVEHWLNGVRVVKYKRGSKDFLERKADTKFKNVEKYGEQKCGHILLTDHGDKVFFKNIKIRKL
ncbi:protein of unknown function [Mariniphaga anaerophila]|uniref:3-keto-alpha-glucoside-1,2-lyase/3-keto-2-hydroxy-glucal hydratase domain-containing protein n=1 Tax=Mariniphaga anaerophila TaxID=1484053 RepID=A0A1M5FEJ8_9BACT|nr:DUF1080 domain-containing protein [Mariniphaga anaerophila]SHF89869.1 protein of unknown function [Mariniphaga anaerophila]